MDFGPIINKFSFVYHWIYLCTAIGTLWRNLAFWTFKYPSNIILGALLTDMMALSAENTEPIARNRDTASQASLTFRTA